MAVTVNVIRDDVNVKVAEVIATADADRDALFTYTNAFIPDSANYEALIRPGGNTDAAADAAGLSAWVVSRVPTSTAVQCRKTAAVNSGNAAVQARVVVFRRLSPTWT